MRIAMVSADASPLAGPGGPGWGGQNVHVAELSKALGAAGHEVTVWTRRDDVELPDAVPFAPGVTVRHLDAGPPAPLPGDRLVPHVPALAAALERAWTADRPDVVHAHFWSGGLAATAAAGRLGIELVATFHSLGTVERRYLRADDPSPAGRVPAEQAVAGRAAAVIATCTEETSELIRMGVPRRRISVVPAGVDLDAFTPHGPAFDRSAAPRLVAVGVRRRGVDDVLRALRQVSGAELLVAGGPAHRDIDADPDVTRLRATARSAGVADRVRFLGAVPRADMPALLRSADAVVCTPWYEPFGMVALEAMACGRAVVATAVGGLLDSVVPGVTGRHVPPRRPEAIAAALRDLLAGPAMVQAHGIAGRDRAAACFGWTRVAECTAEIYGRVTAAATPVAEATVTRVAR